MRQTIPLLLVSLAIPALAQTSDAGAEQALSTSLAATAKSMHSLIRRNLAEAAAAMPAESYSFKPTAEIRSFAQLIGHVTNANFFFCSAAKGEPYPSKVNAETLTAKDAAVKALNQSLAYCDAVYQDLTDAKFGERATVGGGGKPTETTRGATLMFNTTHNNEHYGNIIVYLRLKGIVPPSTARAQKGKQSK